MEAFSASVEFIPRASNPCNFFRIKSRAWPVIGLRSFLRISS